MNQTFLKPILQAISACFLWGLVFVTPLYLKDFSSFDIVLGRFLVYGGVSTLFLLYTLNKNQKLVCLNYWKEAALSALIMNVIYFSALVYGSRLTAPSIITLIIGTGPITITLCSCLLKNDKKLLSLFFLPSLAIFLGLFLMSLEAINSEISGLTLQEHFQGFFFGFIALFAWTWYVIYNSKVLKENKEINPIHWTALIGFMTFLFALGALFFHVSTNENHYFTQFSPHHEMGQTFWMGVLTLGILCSWAAFTLWNLAGSKLHPALSGQLSILETFFGIILIYSLKQEMPTLLEGIGAFLILIGVSVGLYSYSKKVENLKEKG